MDEAEDEAIETLINTALKDLTFDGHTVVNVPVKCTDSKVEIHGNLYDNDTIEQEETEVIQKIMENSKMTSRKLREEHPEIAKKLHIILKHVDIRSHGYCLRKCSPLENYSCDYCRGAPPRSSLKVWRSLPRRDAGGLFYDCEPDPNKPGHYRTLLDMLKNVNNIIVRPDSMFPEVLRCKVKQKSFYLRQ